MEGYCPTGIHMDTLARDCGCAKMLEEADEIYCPSSRGWIPFDSHNYAACMVPVSGHKFRKHPEPLKYEGDIEEDDGSITPGTRTLRLDDRDVVIPEPQTAADEIWVPSFSDPSFDPNLGTIWDVPTELQGDLSPMADGPVKDLADAIERDRWPGSAPFDLPPPPAIEWTYSEGKPARWWWLAPEVIKLVAQACMWLFFTVFFALLAVGCVVAWFVVFFMLLGLI